MKHFASLMVVFALIFGLGLMPAYADSSASAEANADAGVDVDITNINKNKNVNIVIVDLGDILGDYDLEPCCTVEQNASVTLSQYGGSAAIMGDYELGVGFSKSSNTGSHVDPFNRSNNELTTIDGFTTSGRYLIGGTAMGMTSEVHTDSNAGCCAEVETLAAGGVQGQVHYYAQGWDLSFVDTATPGITVRGSSYQHAGGAGGQISGVVSIH